MQAPGLRAISLLAISAVLVLGAGASLALALQAQPADAPKKPEKQWKDRAEYDLYVAITKEQNPEGRLKLLNDWKTKYVNSEFSAERLKFFLATYQQLNRPADLINTAREILAQEPNNPDALIAITFFTTSLPKASPEDLATGEKAARGLLENLDKVFSAERKPQNVGDADWQKNRNLAEAAGHRTLGWVHYMRKENEQAEQEFLKALKGNPAQGDVSYWLGTVILAQKKPEKQSEALFHFARAAAYEGPGALSPEGRKQVDAYLTKAYNTYHGQDPAGLQELKNLAKSHPLPPEAFKIKSSVEIALDKEEELKKSNPQLALWLNIKKELMGPNGQQYFETSMKGAEVPELKGKVVSQKPERGPTKEVQVGIEHASVPEITLKLDEAFPNKAEPGTEIAFKGVASSYSKEPFMVIFDVEKEKITGWPAPARRAPAKKPPKKKTGKQ